MTNKTEKAQQTALVQTPQAEAQQLSPYRQQQLVLDRIRKYALLPDVVSHFQRLLGDYQGRRYVESVLIQVAARPDLQACTPRSLMQQAARAASLQLSVDPVLKQAHLVVRNGDQADMIVDYHGLVQLTEATGWYIHPPHVAEVFEGETVEIDRLTGRVKFGGQRTGDKIIGWCGYFKSKAGIERWLYMTNEECDAHGKRYNPKGFASQRSAWATDRDKMRRKTVLRQLVTRWGYFSPVVTRVLAAELDGEQPEIIDLPSDEGIQGELPPPRPRDQVLKELGFE